MAQALTEQKSLVPSYDPQAPPQALPLKPKRALVPSYAPTTLGC